VHVLLLLVRAEEGKSAWVDERGEARSFRGGRALIGTWSGWKVKS
jgi:hypothetical protein